MKKFYSLIAIAAIAISANAEGRLKATTEPVVVNGPTATAVISIQGKKIVNGARTTAKDFEGSYTLSGSNALSSGSFSGELTITLNNALSNDVTISGLPQGFTIQGTIDPDEETLSIPNNQYLGVDNGGDECYFYFKGVTEDGDLADGASSIDESVATYSDGVFRFPAYEFWAIGDPANESLGWWMLGYNAKLTYIDPNADPNEGWDDFSTATFTDGWVVSGYLDNNNNPILPSNYPWTVNIQKSQTNDYLYRIDCPYAAESSPISGGKGYYVFSLEDPEYVIVYPGVASGATNGANAICGFNMEGFYLDNGYTKDVVQQAGVLSEYSSYNEEEGLVTIKNCRFNYPTASDKAYSWQDSEGNSLAANMVSTVTFLGDKPSTGIEDIITDKTDINAPAEYYNIQGMKVKNPTPGSIYIVRKGGKVSKMLVK